MKLEAFRRREQSLYSELQEFLDSLGDEENPSPQIYELWSSIAAQVERLSFMSDHKVTLLDQFNNQDVTRSIEHGAITTIGTKSIRGQPRNVQWKSSEYFGAKEWDWRVVDAQVIEVEVFWRVPPNEPVDVTFSVFGE